MQGRYTGDTGEIAVPRSRWGRSRGARWSARWSCPYPEPYPYPYPDPNPYPDLEREQREVERGVIALEARASRRAEQTAQDACGGGEVEGRRREIRCGVRGIGYLYGRCEGRYMGDLGEI